MFEHFNYIPYMSTNENLDAIIAGMDLKPNDSVLAICGSGDQAIAILEYVNKVTAVDYNHKQVTYARERFEHIKKGKFKKFLLSSLDNDEKRYFKKKKYHYLYPPTVEAIKYFEKSGRLDNIKLKADNIEFITNNIFLLEEKLFEYNKIYLSNAFAHGRKVIDYDRIPQFFKQFSPHTLIYLSRNPNFIHKDIYRPIGDAKNSLFAQSLKNIDIHADTLLTKKSRSYYNYHWDPIVLRIGKRDTN